MLNKVIVLSIIPFILLAANVPPSNQPPGGLSIDNVPQFVVLGFDDNSKSNDAANGGGNQAMEWILNFLKNRKNRSQSSPNTATFDGTPARVSFYSNTCGFQNWDQEDPDLLKASHKRAYDEGHEIGNHTHSHGTTSETGGSPEIVMNWSLDTWSNEVSQCSNLLSSAGINQADIIGFRNPFLAYSANTYTTISSLGFKYDCSIEDGWETEMDGTNFTWPYTLDNGSEGANYTDSWGGHKHVDPVPGFWELPNTPIIVPPNEKCSKYGVDSDLRKSIHDRVYEKTKMELGGPVDWDTVSAKITGFDYNAWIKFQLTGKEMEAILKYTLDLRLQGNRAPFMFGTHSQYYCPSYYMSNSWTLNTTLDEMKNAIEGFIDYALSRAEVRMIPAIDIINWCENPVGLDKQSVISEKKSNFNNLKKLTLNNSINLLIPNGKVSSIKLFSINGKSKNIIYNQNRSLKVKANLSKGIYMLLIRYNDSYKSFTTKVLIK